MKSRLLAFTTAALLLCAAAAAAGATPLAGVYEGHSTTNVSMGRPQPFSMTIAQGVCPPAGAAYSERRKAYCVTVNANSGPQEECPAGDITELFFPATQPIALPKSLRISHLYPLYADAGGSIYVERVAGATKIGSFDFKLTVSTHGRASGSMRYITHDATDGTCDSGTVRISATRKG